MVKKNIKNKCANQCSKGVCDRQKICVSEPVLSSKKERREIQFIPFGVRFNGINQDIADFVISTPKKYPNDFFDGKQYKVKVHYFNKNGKLKATKKSKVTVESDVLPVPVSQDLLNVSHHFRIQIFRKKKGCCFSMKTTRVAIF